MGNFSRETFNQLKHYVSVRLQQGVPIVDADWNELQDIRKHELEALLKWYVGDGVPLGNKGFAIASTGAEDDFSIADGHCLVEGWTVINDWTDQHPDDLTYTSQPLFDNEPLAKAWGVEPPPLPLSVPAAFPSDTVYLDVWEREVDSTEDSDIVNSKIAIETCVRTRREWVVRVAEGGTIPTPLTGHVHYPLATLNRAAQAVTDLRRTGLNLATLKEKLDLMEQGPFVGDLVVNGRLEVDVPVNGGATAITADAISDLAVNKYGVVATATGAAGRKHGLYGVATGDDTEVKYGIYGLSTGEGGSKYGVHGSASGGGTNFALYGYASGTGTKYGVRASAFGNDSTTKFGGVANASGAGGTKYGLQGIASGVGGTRYGVYGSAYGDDADQKNGMYGVASGTDGEKCGVRSYATGEGGTKYGLRCDVTGIGGAKFGVYSTVNGNDNDTKWGVYGRALATGGIKYGVVGYVLGDDSYNKYGLHGTAYGTGGLKYGVYAGAGADDDDKKYGLYADAWGIGGQKFGVYAVARGDDAQDKFALRGYATATSGTKYGVYGLASGGGTNYGIYANANGGTTNLAGYFVGDVQIDGNVQVNGNLSKTSGSFLIDHVLDPENRVLRHSFVESPEALCLYRGKVTLGPAGTASIDMPAYFAALTREEEATVLLTPIGTDPGLFSYTWHKEHTQLMVHGDAGARASYLVLADRDDPVIRLLRRPVEEDKEEAGFVKGEMLYPEAFGRPRDDTDKGKRPEPPREEVEATPVSAAEDGERQAAENRRIEKEVQALEAEAEELEKTHQAAAAAEREMIERAKAKADKGKKQAPQQLRPKEKKGRKKS